MSGSVGSSWGRAVMAAAGAPVGSAVKERFRDTGTFRFRCTYHSTLIGSTCTGMCGSVQVTA